jgi:hypothetical protein
MKKHAFDLTSFLFGSILAVGAVGVLLAEQYSWDVDGRWVLPAALILLGVAGVAGAISGLRGSERSAPEDVQRDESGDVGSDADDLGSSSDVTST